VDDAGLQTRAHLTVEACPLEAGCRLALEYRAETHCRLESGYCLEPEYQSSWGCRLEPELYQSDSGSLDLPPQPAHSGYPEPQA
jgi:hypothetical protein